MDPYNKKDLVGLDPMRMTYGQMIQPIDRLALKFLQLGIKKDDVIIVQLPNIIELTLTIFAAARAGAIASPIPIQWRAHEIRDAVKLTEAKIFVSSHNLLGFNHISMVRKAVEEGSSLHHFITVGSGMVPEAIQMSNILADDGGNIDSLTARRAKAMIFLRSAGHLGRHPRSSFEAIITGLQSVAPLFSLFFRIRNAFIFPFPDYQYGRPRGRPDPMGPHWWEMVFHHPFNLGCFSNN